MGPECRVAQQQQQRQRQRHHRGGVWMKIINGCEHGGGIGWLVSSPTTTTAVRRSDSTKRSLSDHKSEVAPPGRHLCTRKRRPACVCPGNVSSRLPVIPRLLPDDDFPGETCRTDPNDNR